jgi:hypothetical protein
MVSTPAPPAASKEQLILQVIQLALAGLQAVPVTAAGAAIASVFLGIFQNATALFEQQTGLPFDVTKIPLETPVP